MTQAERIRYLSSRVGELDAGNQSLHAALLLRCLALSPDGSLSLNISEGLALRAEVARNVAKSENETNNSPSEKEPLPKLLDYHALRAIFPDFDPFANSLAAHSSTARGRSAAKSSANDKSGSGQEAVYLEQLQREKARETVLMNLYKEWIA